ncbi:hypothetical protein A9Q89_03680 [Gammaproteobacteria bacterium 53_120_T64]|nr:hypothetical protein A9Q89_03680 [Gammaproteobacteria bacterium 53_120_T64]
MEPGNYANILLQSNQNHPLVIVLLLGCISLSLLWCFWGLKIRQFILWATDFTWGGNAGGMLGTAMGGQSYGVIGAILGGLLMGAFWVITVAVCCKARAFPRQRPVPA